MRERIHIKTSITAIVKPIALATMFLAAPAFAHALEPATNACASLAANKLEEALDTVDAGHIKTDIFFIASDELGGRDTPSLGLKIAARFIRARLERLGWKPGAPDGFFFTYKLNQRRLDEVASKIDVQSGATSHELRYGRDYFLPSISDIAEVSTSAGVVFCGAGETEDFEHAQPNGRWAVCVDSSTDIRKVRRRAKDAKAIGLIVVPGPAYSGEPYAARFGEDLGYQRRGSVSYPSPSSEKEREQFPAIRISADAAAKCFASLYAGALPALGTDLVSTVSETRKLEGDGGQIDLENVCGFWPGSDPSLGKEVILVSAHYDHLGTHDGVVFNGADDNGSGTCGLLAMAEALARFGPLRRSVMLIWVSGEEKGLWGSRAWSEHPWLPEGTHAIADINIDMIGRNAPDKLLVTPTATRSKDYNGLVRLAESLSPLEGFPELGSADDYYQRSDHANFAKLGIPVMFLFSDVHEDYHKSTDKPEKIDGDKIRRVVRLVLRMIDGLQGDRLDL